MIEYKVISEFDAVKNHGYKSDWYTLEELENKSKYGEDNGMLFRVEDGQLHLVCYDGSYDSPEDNFFFRHYAPVIDELNRLAKAYDELLVKYQDG